MTLYTFSDTNLHQPRVRKKKTNMGVLLISSFFVITLIELGICQRGAPPFGARNDVRVCTAETPGGEWVRRGSHLRRRGDCQQGFFCDGDQILPFRAPCPDTTYFSVHTGTCSFPNIYAFVFGSFNCTAEEDDENLDFERLTGNPRWPLFKVIYYVRNRSITFDQILF